MRIYIVLLLIITLSSCHTRKVAVSRVDSLVKKDAVYRDRTITITKIKLDTLIRVDEHVLKAPQHRVYEPFTVSDPVETIQVRYDTINHYIYVQATKKVQEIKAQVEKSITRKNDIIATVKEQVRVNKKIKDIKASGIPMVFYIVGGVLLLVLGLVFLYFKK